MDATRLCAGRCDVDETSPGTTGSRWTRRKQRKENGEHSETPHPEKTRRILAWIARV